MSDTHTDQAPRDEKEFAWGWRIPDALWECIVPLLPRPTKVHPLGCHRKRVDDRAAMNAIFFVLRTGCQWNALNATGICSSSSPTVASWNGPKQVCSSCSGYKG